MSERLVFTEDEWNREAPEVARQMHYFAQQFSTVIPKHLGDHGQAWGTGAYVRMADKVFIITNEHVARARSSTQTLLHKLNGREDFYPIVGDHASFGPPLDIALLPVSMEIWEKENHSSKAITLDMISIAHATAPTELLMFAGFAGDGSSFHFEMLFTPGTTSTSREISLPEDDRFDNRFHFGLDYKPDLASKVVGTRDLPRPPGFSGSIVWNSGFVESRITGEAWSPELARVTGIVWGWPSTHGCLVATRSEYVRSFLLAALEQMRSAARSL